MANIGAIIWTYMNRIYKTLLSSGLLFLALTPLCGAETADPYHQGLIVYLSNDPAQAVSCLRLAEQKNYKDWKTHWLWRSII